jgi:hypothetical protein
MTLAEFVQKMKYGVVPPETVAVAVPLHSLKQLAFVVIVAISSVSMIIDRTAGQSFASVTVSV